MILSKGGSEEGRRILAQIAQDKPTVTLASDMPNVTKPGPNLLQKTQDTTAMDIANIPKSIQASEDISFGFRQGLGAITRPDWWKAWSPSIKALVSEDAANASKLRLTQMPRFQEAVNNGLALTEMPTNLLPKGLTKNIAKRIGLREEQFASKIAEKIPGVKASGRAYSTFANELRFNLYDSIATQAEKNGINMNKKNIADYINTLTGRGSMGLRIGESSQRLEDASHLLNTVFWSPRFVASRVQLLNPFSYTKMDNFTRLQALRDLGPVIAGTGAILKLLDLNGYKVDFNPTSTDFLKVQVGGKTKIDMTGGMAPIMRFFAQAGNKMLHMDDPKVQGPNVMRFGRSKFSPVMTFLTDATSGTDYIGNKTQYGFDSKKDTIQNITDNVFTKLFVPMVIKDLSDLYHNDPESVGWILPGLIGGSVQVYGDRKKKGSSTGMPTVKLPSMPTF